MKTKEEIVNHLYNVGYTEQAMHKIVGFLIGSGIKEEDEVITLKKGSNGWHSFWAWYNSEDVDLKSVDFVDSLIDDVMIAGITNNSCLLKQKLNFLYGLREELLKDEE